MTATRPNFDNIRSRTGSPSGARKACLPPFATACPGSMRIESELMVLDPFTYGLLPAAEDILHLLDQAETAWAATLAAKGSMLEIRSSELGSYHEAATEMEAMRSSLGRAASTVGALISGGGAHPSHKWNEESIGAGSPHRDCEEMHIDLARLFTVYGMRVHIGVPNADEAMRVAAWLAQRAPLFTALSASSPCWQGAVSGFCSVRSNVASTLPMSGAVPANLHTWQDFVDLFDHLARYGIVSSIEDLNWDVRPRPKHGTIEMRVLDTPLHPGFAAALASYARELCLEVMEQPGAWPRENSPETYKIYKRNCFSAAKEGILGRWRDPCSGKENTIGYVVRSDLARLVARSDDPDFPEVCLLIEALLQDGGQARWLTARRRPGAPVQDLARVASEMFCRPLPPMCATGGA